MAVNVAGLVVTIRETSNLKNFSRGVKIMPVRNITLWNEPAVNGYHAIDNFNYALFIGENK
jgi:hypothetical protein